jgi:hypothetical protein
MNKLLKTIEKSSVMLKSNTKDIPIISYISNNIIIFIMLVIIFYDFDLSSDISSLINSQTANIVFFVCSTIVFVYVSPIAGIMSMIAFVTLINKAKTNTHSKSIYEQRNSEKTKMKYIKSLNHNDKVTLEEKMVQLRVPLVGNKNMKKAKYIPTAEYTHNAIEL